MRLGAIINKINNTIIVFWGILPLDAIEIRVEAVALYPCTLAFAEKCGSTVPNFVP